MYDPPAAITSDDVKEVGRLVLDERHGDVLRFVSLTIVTLSLSVLRYAGSRRTPDLYRPEDRPAAGIRTSTDDARPVPRP